MNFFCIAKFCKFYLKERNFKAYFKIGIVWKRKDLLFYGFVSVTIFSFLNYQTKKEKKRFCFFFQIFYANHFNFRHYFWLFCCKMDGFSSFFEYMEWNRNGECYRFFSWKYFNEKWKTGIIGTYFRPHC